MQGYKIPQRKTAKTGPPNIPNNPKAACKTSPSWAATNVKPMQRPPYTTTITLAYKVALPSVSPLRQVSLSTS